MRARIAHYRRADPASREDFMIGCRILLRPFFLPRSEWISVPESWSMNIVTFKTYSTDNREGLDLWHRVEPHLRGEIGQVQAVVPPPGMQHPEQARYGSPTLIAPRLGQGTFRVLVTDMYNRRCAITGERTLPALEAAHIRPYAESGSHEPSNGLLLRRDIHSLFDSGYVTVTPDLRFEVSNRIREEFENGRHYYALQGKALTVPEKADLRPDRAALEWHNSTRFRG